ncbi:hypothetical protein CLV92_107144 [Kineococcus xinjiangensis]|uniref:Homeodomain-like domain-containing protein n=1 Tax=Kineococcus xinjiangensis TaxID=512762 RepID=A0A2S6IKE2_9ACTN|nr:hypothetical protein [Kineococcus xinjiangensis]PPK94641.1 hypothetical protein CLV92_107144 [Kineococcus xinjiangensis]
MDAPQLALAATDTSDSSRGLRAVAALRRLLETLELRQVERALHQGASWSEIAADLGVTRQAVHKKYAKRLRDVVAEPAGTEQVATDQGGRGR